MRWHRLVPARASFTRHRAAVVGLLVLALAFYTWTAASSVPFDFSSGNSDVYNQLTTAFLHLHTYLPIAVPTGLLHATDPYNPTVNGPVQAAYPAIHDLALYHGHFYSPWGPTPLVLFLPFRLTGLRMSPTFAVVVFAFLGLVFGVAALHMLVRRFLAGTPNWVLLVATVGLALTNVAPFLLRRPIQYEVAISCGYCFEMGGVLLVLRGAFAQRHQARWLALASLCFGLAVGARISLAPGCLVPPAAAAYLVSRRGLGRRIVLAATAPAIACIGLLAAYNLARFGSASNFGEGYQIATFDQHNMGAARLAYVPPGMFSYLLMPFRLGLGFPHVFLVTTARYPGPFPARYAGSRHGWPPEPAGGLFPTMPITFLLLSLPWMAWKLRERLSESGEGLALLVASGASLVGLAIMLLLAYAFWGTTQRYEVDYATYFLLAAFLVWSVLLGRRSRGTRGRRVIATLGVVLTAIGSIVGTAVSFTGYYSLSISHPGTFDALEDITSPFATLATMIVGRPVMARVSDSLQISDPNDSFTTLGAGGTNAWIGVGQGPVTVVIDSPRSERTYLETSILPGVGAPPFSKLSLKVTSPGKAPLTLPVPPPGPLHMPIALHWGLNRIKIELFGRTGASPNELYLGDLELP